MADGQKFQKSRMQGGPKFLRCIPNQTVIQNIAPKMTWASSIQRAFRRWRSRRRSLPATTSTGMADGREFQTSGVQGGQELLPCIPNHITIQNIAPKMTWEALNVMQMVPPIPMASEMMFHVESICLDGRIYLWISKNNSKRTFRSCMEIWTLDVAGDRQWAMCARVNAHIDTCPFQFSNGVLDRKLYRFGGNNGSFHSNVLEAQDSDVRREEEKSLWLKVRYLPQTEIYDPSSNIFSIITPEPLSLDVLGTISKADLKKHFASFCDWEHLRTGSSAITGCYEPFYSEWRTLPSTTLAGENDYYPRNAMAPQVYHSNYRGDERFFFIGEKLVKLVYPGLRQIRELLVERIRVGFTYGGPGETVDLQMYDTQKGIWEHWQSFPNPYAFEKDCRATTRVWDGAIEYAVFDGAPIFSCVFADNFIWILVTVCPIPCLKDSVKFALLRSSPFLGKGADCHSGAWTDPGCSMNHLLNESSMLRPIYL